MERYNAAIRSMKWRIREWKADKSLDIVWSTIEKTLVPYYEREKEDVRRAKLQRVSMDSDFIADLARTSDKVMSGVVNDRECNGFLPISSRENTGVDVNRTSTTEIREVEAGNLEEGIDRTGVIFPKQCDMEIQAAGHRDLNAVGGAVENQMVADQLHTKESNPDDDVLLLDSFLDDEEVPSHSLFASVCLSSMATEVMDELHVLTAREDTPASSVGTDESEESEEGLFSEALNAYISKVEENVPGLAVLGEVNFIAECFGYTLTRRSSRITNTLWHPERRNMRDLLAEQYYKELL
ncbi:hypothetical protein BWQ96_03181 [Gracilariopsis chorda]|uniref:Uncharacterized protein n=1 Tax=Gracilariopsis chorda TaxID=448386 RepID=A0A2V3IY00_9FLOR|nr:hypothetical protein BWQ96_03181 [Gracilariopsis chorda]|eukprot:PXF46991.1 hypothetical protein BWQ96_03181 [Gracilariopsis chorda]